MTRTLKIVLPVVVVTIGVLAAWVMFLARESPDTRVPEPVPPLVRVVPVELRDVRLSVASQGTVSPRTETTLIPEIAGRVVEVAPAFADGGFFRRGERLLAIDPRDYRQALAAAEAGVAQAELRLERERAEAAVARREWEALGGDGEASALTLREPQVREAEAALEAARAVADRARRDLERTEILAPYDARVRDKLVDVGQYVTPGTRLATIYAVDWAEVRLPLPNRDLAFVDLPLDYRGETSAAAGPEVVLRAEFAGGTYEWRGRIVRVEGEIDPKTRMVHAVARVRDPYGRSPGGDRPPLAAGMFVEAEIQGREVADVAVVPRSAVRRDGRVLVADADDRLRFRDVELLRTTEDRAIVRSGLSAGDRVVLSNLAAVTEGMRVRVDGAAGPDDDAPSPARPASGR